MEVQRRNNDKEIYAPLKNKWLANKPEEEVRQKYICRLVNNYGYSLDQMDQEVPVVQGNGRRGKCPWIAPMQPNQISCCNGT